MVKICWFDVEIKPKKSLKSCKKNSKHTTNASEFKQSFKLQALSIPVREDESGKYTYCYQYDVNFTQIFEENGRQWPEKADSNWPKSECQNGWDYDRSEYKDTLVTEVSKHVKALHTYRQNTTGDE